MTNEIAPLCFGSYKATQVPGAVIIFADGWHNTSGFSVWFEQSLTTVYPPEFTLRHRPPSGVVREVLTPFRVHVMFGATDRVKAVKVHDAHGSHEIPVEPAPDAVKACADHHWVDGAVSALGVLRVRPDGRDGWHVDRGGRIRVNEQAFNGGNRWSSWLSVNWQRVANLPLPNREIEIRGPATLRVHSIDHSGGSSGTWNRSGEHDADVAVWAIDANPDDGGIRAGMCQLILTA